MKQLIIRHRTLDGAAPDLLSRYDDAWRTLVQAVLSAGGKAWRFRGSPDSSRFIEFIESESGQDIARNAAVAAALQSLAILVAAESESTWEEWQG